MPLPVHLSQAERSKSHGLDKPMLCQIQACTNGQRPDLVSPPPLTLHPDIEMPLSLLRVSVKVRISTDTSIAYMSAQNDNELHCATRD